MKKNNLKIIVPLLIIILFGILIYIVMNYDIGNLVKNTSTNTESTIKGIDWDNYSSNEITLTKSIKITEEGIYTLTGTIEDGLIYINTNGNVKLVLNNITVTNKSGPAIYIENAKNVEISTVEGTTNTLNDSSSYTNYDEDVTGCIYSKDDLILSGKGTLKINANYKDGIVSKDDLKVTSGTYIINAKDDGIRGKNSVEIEDGNITITSGGDGIKSTNEKDSEKGYINITGGTFTINSVNDGIQTVTKLYIKDGTFTIKTTGNDSAKGLKADTLITIDGGTFDINTTDDSIHTNGNIIINNGKYTINSADDAVHADEMNEINNGTFDITAHEGIEATYIKINDGTINISASDDGINATNKSSAYSSKVEINGGNITIKMGQGDTDGVDSNGDIIINGGTINVTGQSTFDYDGTGTINGGTVICNGQQVTTLPNQFMGGGNMGGQAPNNSQRRGPLR